jgi:acyl carrier protein
MAGRVRGGRIVADVLGGDIPEGRSSDFEARLARVWREVFSRPDLTVSDDFFALGGDSLLALRLISLLRTELGIEVPIRIVFEFPTVESMARMIEESG